MATTTTTAASTTSTTTPVVAVAATITTAATIPASTAATTTNRDVFHDDIEHQCYVSNISHRTTEGDLAKYFAIVGTVRNVTIRYGRKQGEYNRAVVTYQHVKQTKKAIHWLNGRELHGRELYVAYVVPRDTAVAVATTTSTVGVKSDFVEKSNEKELYSTKVKTGTATAAAATTTTTTTATNTTNTTTTDTATTATATSIKQQDRDYDDNDDDDDHHHRGRFARRVSPTTLYVGNLPEECDNDTMKDIFADLKLKDAFVVRFPNGKSKHYGFAVFANEVDKKAAQEITDGALVGDAQIKVRTAYALSATRH
jgi:RNA recognition motif-containing protein